MTYPNNGLVAGAAGRRRRDGAGASAPRCSGCRPAATTRTPAQNTNAANGGYSNLMGTLNDGLTRSTTTCENQGLLGDTLVLQFSEFGRRISENGSQGTDHGAAGLMMAIGGSVRGGIYGTAAGPEPVRRTIRRSRTTAATSRTRPTSARSTRGSSTTGSAPIPTPSSAATSAAERLNFCECRKSEVKRQKSKRALIST